MKIIVCVKVINGELNPFDESALECALNLSKDVTVLSMGPKSTEAVLKPLTRLGAKVVLLSDNVFAGSDTLATAYILSEAIKKIGCDLIVCGRQSIDGDTAQTGAMISAILGKKLITNVISVDADLGVKTRLGTDKIEPDTLITVERGYYLRFPSIFSKIGAVTVWSNDELNCDLSKCGLNGSPTRVLQTFPSKTGKRKCKFISRSELMPLIEELRKQEFSDITKKKSDNKLKIVWAIGEEVAKKAKEIADEVVLIEETDPYKIAELAKKENPPVILWNADLEGRKNAPVVAGLINTGLCADCTELEVENDDLIMYRPARSGDIIAKIKCLTYPRMATVRTQSKSGDVIIAGGKGVKDGYDKLLDFAKSLNAEIGASRGLVDTGAAPYEQQIGLTGKMVSPKIYVAIGISGAVHHTCAIENSNIIIAINPDKDARIFEYADYGILEKF